LFTGAESANDVNVQEASQGFFMLEQLARAQGVVSEQAGDRVARVLLADEHFAIKTGGGGSYTQRQRCDEQDDADIFIDARSPLILAILSWAAEVGPAQPAVPCDCVGIF